MVQKNGERNGIIYSYVTSQVQVTAGTIIYVLVVLAQILRQLIASSILNCPFLNGYKNKCVNT